MLSSDLTLSSRSGELKNFKKMKAKEIKVLSYFINDQHDTFGGDGGNFKTMYGEGSSFINVENLGQLAKSLNQMFI